MRLKDLYIKLKVFRLKRLLVRDGGRKKRKVKVGKASWMMPVSHGYHVVEDQPFRNGSDESDSDSVVVQREQIEELELWFFGVFDARIGDVVTKYMQSHLFDKKPKQSHIRRKSKEAMRKAYLWARAKMREAQEADADETWRVGSASVMVINGEKLVIANMGDYRAVVCRDGVAHQINSNHQHPAAKRHWSRRYFSGMLACQRGNTAESGQCKGSELAVGAEKIDSDTEFVIIASNGIWEVMKNQEAMSLIRHIEDPQVAAGCLAKEALSRMSKSSISCVVIRFG